MIMIVMSLMGTKPQQCLWNFRVLKACCACLMSRTIQRKVTSAQRSVTSLAEKIAQRSKKKKFRKCDMVTCFKCVICYLKRMNGLLVFKTTIKKASQP